MGHEEMILRMLGAEPLKILRFFPMQDPALKKLCDVLVTKGYVWYKDFYLEYEDLQIELQIYNKGLVKKIDSFLLEVLI